MNTPIAEEENLKSICKTCKHRFRRVFIPSNMQNFLDLDEEDTSEEGEENVIIMTMCLASDMDLDLDATIECTHYESKMEATTSLFKHKK
jgi:hypothetical protein